MCPRFSNRRHQDPISHRFTYKSLSNFLPSQIALNIQLDKNIASKDIIMPGSGETIVITGASGQYGSLVIEGLSEKGIPPSSIMLLTRNPSKLAKYASKGFLIRQGSFDDPVSQLAEALAGSKTMLMISTSRAGQRLPQHQTAIDAAVKAGVSHIVYTSIVSAHLDDPTALVGKEHKATGMSYPVPLI